MSSTDRRTDRRTDGRTRWIQYTPPPTSLGGGIKIQYGRQAAILKVTSLKINRLLPMTTINMHMKFEIEIPKQTWVMLRKPCRLQTDGRTRWIQYTPPPTLLGGGIIIVKRCYSQCGSHFYSPPHLSDGHFYDQHNLCVGLFITTQDSWKHYKTYSAYHCFMT